MNKVKCPSCNEEILADYDRCPYCGYQIRQPLSTKKQNKKQHFSNSFEVYKHYSNKANKISSNLIGGICLIIFGVAIFILSFIDEIKKIDPAVQSIFLANGIFLTVIGIIVTIYYVHKYRNF